MENLANKQVHGKSMTVNYLVKVAILSVFSYILMLVSIPIPIFAIFLEIDLSDLPAIIGVMALGPLAGVFIELIKNLLHIMVTSTAGIGEIANFTIGVALVVPFGLVYKHMKSTKGFIIGAIVGTTVMVIVACIFNYYIFLPLFAEISMSPEAMAEFATQVNKYVTNFKTFIVFAIIPFNLLKAVIEMTIGYFLYKSLRHVINKMQYI